MLLILTFLASLAMMVLKLVFARPALTLAVLLGFAVGSYVTLRQAPPPAADASSSLVKKSGGKSVRAGKAAAAPAIF